MAKKRTSNMSLKKNSTSFDTLSNSLLSSQIPFETYTRIAANFMLEIESNGFSEKFSKLYKTKRFASILPANINKLENFGKLGVFGFNHYLIGNLQYFRLLFNLEKEKLNNFKKQREQYEIHILNGNYEKASTALEIIFSSYGESYWLIRNKILLLSLTEDYTAAQAYTQKCLERSADPFASHAIRCFMLISINPLVQIKKLVSSNIQELDEAGEARQADLLRAMFLPRPLLEDVRAAHCLRAVQGFPLIDQYVLLDNFFSEALSFEYEEEDAFNTIQEIVTEIRKSVPIDTSSRNYLNIVAAYEKGEYQSTIDAFNEEIEKNTEATDLISLTAKSYAYLNKRPEKNSIINNFISILADIYKLSQPPAQLQENISKTVVLLSNFRCMYSLQLSLYKSMPLTYDDDQVIWLAHVCTHQNKQTTPLTQSLASGNFNSSEKYLTQQTDLPSYRILREKIDNTSDDDVANELIRELKRTSPLLKDYCEAAARYFVKKGHIDKLIEHSAAALTANQHAYISLPMRKLIEEIENKMLSSIDSVVLSYYYAKKINPNKEYLLNETYEDFLHNNNATKPSELLTKLDISDAKNLVFFRDISNIGTMDFLGAFADSSELRAERVKILDFLKDHGVIDAKQHAKEVDEIVLQVAIDAGATEFNIAKIDVNDAALKRDLIEDLTALHQVYLSLKPEQHEKLFRIEAGIESETPRALAAGDKNSTLHKMIKLVWNGFLYDEKHGLDKNLSTEIRHGFFSNLLRSRLEEAHLITEADDRGIYKPNDHWLQHYTIVSQEIMLAVDAQLSWFSAEFNKLIHTAEEWIKVSSSNDPTERIFDYSLAATEFEHIQRCANSSTEDFFNYCLSLLWVKTERFLHDTREKLNVELRQRIDLLFEQLISRINDSRSGAILVGLTTAIYQAREGIKEDISTISEWFNRNTSYADREQTLRNTIDIAIECFGRIRGFTPQINKSLHELPNIILDGNAIKSFILSFVNLLENACRHSGHGAETKITILAGQSKHRQELTIRNNLTHENLSKLDKTRLEKIKTDMHGPSSLGLMRIEGGSGLGKAYYHLTDINWDVELDVLLENSEFVARISYAA